MILEEQVFEKFFWVSFISKAKEKERKDFVLFTGFPGSWRYHQCIRMGYPTLFLLEGIHSYKQTTRQQHNKKKKNSGIRGKRLMINTVSDNVLQTFTSFSKL